MNTKEKLKFSIYKISDTANSVEQLTTYLFSKGYQKITCNDPTQVLFICRSRPESPNWLTFLEEIVEDSSDLELTKLIPSFVLLKFIDEYCYAVTGGNGHHHIKKYIDEDFGLDIISRILDSDKIKLIRQSILTGKVAQQEKIFKELYNYNFDHSNWGKLTKEIVGEIDTSEFCEIFDIKGGMTKNIKLSGKSSFWIGKGITSEELTSIIMCVHNVNQMKQKINLFNGYHQIKDKTFTEILSSQLFKELEMQFEEYRYSPKQFRDSGIYISYSDAKELLLCDRYEIRLPGKKVPEIVDILDLTTVFQTLIERGYNEFKNYFFSQIRIIGLSDNDIETDVQGGLKKFVYAEIYYNNQNYYFIDRKWYQLTPEFQNEINKKINELIAQCSSLSFKLPEWERNVRTEPEYISKVCENNDFIEMHSKHIFFGTGKSKTELCDIISSKDDVNLVYIKRGTGSSLRELFSQARISVEVFKNDVKFRANALSKVNQILKSKNMKEISFEKFNVVLAIKDNSLNRSRKTVVDKLTILAKLDLINCVNFIKNELGIENVIIYEFSEQKSIHSPVEIKKRSPIKVV